jgi:hypothetical protein
MMKIEVSKELLFDYYSSLVNECFKLLPVFEGRDLKTNKIIHSKEVAYLQYKKYLVSFLNEIYGSYYMLDSIYLLRLLANLEGMLGIQLNEHDKLKSLVFKCIGIVNKLKEEMEFDT